MGLLDRLFGKQDETVDMEPSPPQQARYDHHAPIDLGEWDGSDEPEFEFSAEPDPQATAACNNHPAGEGPPIVLTVMAAAGDFFEGGDLLREFNAAGLHIGKDHLFHLYPEHGERAPLFSVSNVLNPGVFDPQKIMTLQTRGLVLFLRLPSAHSGKHGFEALVECANTLARGLGGEVMDAERRPISNHMLQRMQEQILEFEYCQELARRKAQQQGRK